MRAWFVTFYLRQWFVGTVSDDTRRGDVMDTPKSNVMDKDRTSNVGNVSGSTGRQGDGDSQQQKGNTWDKAKDEPCKGNENVPGTSDRNKGSINVHDDVINKDRNQPTQNQTGSR